MRTAEEEAQDEADDAKEMGALACRKEPKKITESGLRALLGEGIDEALFKFLYHLFDTDGSGLVNGTDHHTCI